MKSTYSVDVTVEDIGYEYRMTDRDLYLVFSKYGHVDIENTGSKAVVTFPTKEQAAKAIAELHKKPCNDGHLAVCWSPPPGENGWNSWHEGGWNTWGNGKYGDEYWGGYSGANGCYSGSGSVANGYNSGSSNYPTSSTNNYSSTSGNHSGSNYASSGNYSGSNYPPTVYPPTTIGANSNYSGSYSGGNYSSGANNSYSGSNATYSGAGNNSGSYGVGNTGSAGNSGSYGANNTGNYSTTIDNSSYTATTNNSGYSGAGNSGNYNVANTNGGNYNVSSANSWGDWGGTGTWATWDGTVKKYTCRIDVGLQNEENFYVAKKLIGIKGANMKLIVQQTQAKLRLRGKDSGYLEGHNNEESDEPLHLCVSCMNYHAYQIAKKMAMDVIQSMLQEYKQYRQNMKLEIPELKIKVTEHPVILCTSNGKSYQRPYPPQGPVPKSSPLSMTSQAAAAAAKKAKEEEEKRLAEAANDADACELGRGNRKPPPSTMDIEKLVERRIIANHNDDEEEAEAIRHYLHDRSVLLLDGPNGNVTTWRYFSIWDTPDAADATTANGSSADGRDSISDTASGDEEAILKVRGMAIKDYDEIRVLEGISSSSDDGSSDDDKSGKNKKEGGGKNKKATMKASKSALPKVVSVPDCPQVAPAPQGSVTQAPVMHISKAVAARMDVNPVDGRRMEISPVAEPILGLREVSQKLEAIKEKRESHPDPHRAGIDEIKARRAAERLARENQNTNATMPTNVMHTTAMTQPAMPQPVMTEPTSGNAIAAMPQRTDAMPTTHAVPPPANTNVIPAANPGVRPDLRSDEEFSFSDGFNETTAQKVSLTTAQEQDVISHTKMNIVNPAMQQPVVHQSHNVSILPQVQDHNVSILPQGQDHNVSILPQGQDHNVSILPQDHSVSHRVPQMRETPNGIKTKAASPDSVVTFAPYESSASSPSPYKFPLEQSPTLTEGEPNLDSE